MNWHSFCDEYKRGCAFLSLGLSFSVSFTLYLSLTCVCLWKKTGKFRERTQFNRKQCCKCQQQQKRHPKRESRHSIQPNTMFAWACRETQCPICRRKIAHTNEMSGIVNAKRRKRDAKKRTQAHIWRGTITYKKVAAVAATANETTLWIVIHNNNVCENLCCSILPVSMLATKWLNWLFLLQNWQNLSNSG